MTFLAGTSGCDSQVSRMRSSRGVSLDQVFVGGGGSYLKLSPVDLKELLQPQFVKNFHGRNTPDTYASPAMDTLRRI